jgi:hypothetical protein
MDLGRYEEAQKLLTGVLEGAGEASYAGAMAQIALAELHRIRGVYSEPEDLISAATATLSRLYLPTLFSVCVSVSVCSCSLCFFFSLFLLFFFRI